MVPEVLQKKTSSSGQDVFWHTSNCTLTSPISTENTMVSVFHNWVLFSNEKKSQAVSSVPSASQHILTMNGSTESFQDPSPTNP